MITINSIFNEALRKVEAGQLAEGRAEEDYIVSKICELDFTDSAVKQNVENFASHILNGKIGGQLKISRAQAKVLIASITKKTLVENGLNDTKIIIRPRTQNDSGGAFYRNDDNSITFFEENICNQRQFLDKYSDNLERSMQGRYNEFNRQLFVLNHEIEHAVQFTKIAKEMKGENSLDSASYIIQMQDCARRLSSLNGVKYRENGMSGLYDTKNHDQFYMELDADKAGYERTLKFLQKVCPKAYDLAVDERIGWAYKKKLEVTKAKLEEYHKETWTHGTNPNNGPVSAMHKTSMIIDSVLPQLGADDKKYVFQNWPAVGITHNEDGSRKTLEQVETEKQKAVSRVNAEKGTAEADKLAKVYETAIEGDAVLSFEKCLQHIARLSSDSDRYFTDSGEEIRYNKAKLFTELKETTEKASMLASYIEDQDAKLVKKTFARYQKEARHTKIRDMKTQLLSQEKKMALIKIENQIHHNRDIKKVEEKEQAEKETKRKELETAKETLKKVFPDFEPHPEIFEFGEKDVIASNNTKEKALLQTAVRDYQKRLTKSKEFAQGNFVPIYQIRDAIDRVYPFEFTPEDQKLVDSMLSSGEIKPIRHVFSEEEKAEPTIEKVSAEELQDMQKKEGLEKKKQIINVSRTQTYQSTNQSDSEMI